jgi:putative DNA primase/helicase
MTTPITVDLIRAALEYIPASLPRDDWVKVCAAIKSEFSDDVGRTLFTEWSATADAYDPKAVASTWKSIKASGGVTIGTLLGMAKEGGLVLPKGNQALAKPDPAKAARLAAERKAAQEAEQAAQDAAHVAAAVEAVKLWESASLTGESPYLARKGVQPFGVRYGAGGWLYVPVRDAAGTLWNVQRIAPERPASGPDKLFLKGGRKSGLWHLCGDAGGALADDAHGPAVVLIAEGYATAASLHEAMGHPVAVAFDAGNLGHVARALRNQHPAALLVLCGDDDVQTHAQTGQNPGRSKAMAAARAVRGLAIFPENLPEGGTDFNDLHHAAGLDAVRTIVQRAIDQHQAAQTAAQAAKSAKTGKGSQSTSREPTEPQNGGGFDRFFVVDGDGVYYTPPGDDGGSPRKVCGVLRVVGLARDSHDNQAALLLEFVTQFGKVRSWLMPLAMLAGDGNAYRTALLSQGFMTPTDGRRRAWLTEYLQSRNPDALERVRHVSRVGWAGRCYVLPNETLGANSSGEKVIFHSEAGIEANFSQRGTAEQWRNDLSRLCVGNSRALFAVSTAFAGPLLAWAQGVSGGGIHYTGQTSIGKTTCFLLAASVWGKGTEKDPDSYMQKWRATSNGLEYQGEQHNDCTLILDELGQMDPGDAGNAAYMLADGMGKTRGKGAGGLRPKPTWRLLFLSSGELTLAQHMETVGKKMKGGQEVRLIPLPTEVKEGSALETFHEFASGHELSGWVQGRAARCYGATGRAWLEHLVDHTEGLGVDLRQRMDSIEAQLMPASASGQVKRGVRRFALIAAAGEMATAAGLTGWPEHEATWAAQTCLDAWLSLRGGAGSSEKASMLRQVRSFFEMHGESRFGFWHRAGDDHAGKVMNRAGLRRVFNADGSPYKDIGNKAVDVPLGAVYEDGGTVTYYVLPEVFTGEVCKGIDLKHVCELLEASGCLIVKEPGRYSVSTKLPGIGKVRCYCITDVIHSIDF